MQNNDPIKDSEKSLVTRTESILLLVLSFLVVSILITLVYQNETKILHFLFPDRIQDFDKMTVTNGFHNIAIENGRSWVLSYEEDHDTLFSGVVRHTSPIQIGKFAILTRDILVTTGEFSDPDSVSTSVSDHHFTWRSLTSRSPTGTIHLLHTIPINEEINQKLNQIKQGDTVMIKGWEIYQVDGFDPLGNYIGTWEDAGCNTTLVTEVIIKESADR